MKKIKSRLYMFAVLGSVVVLTGCPNLFGDSDSGGNDDSGGGSSSRYSVTYRDNSSSSGSAPNDRSDYNWGEYATIKDNTNGLVRDGYDFVGWNTAADGSGTRYEPGDSMRITRNVTLYAEWVDASVYTVTYRAGGADDGTVPSDGTEYGAGETVPVKGNDGGLSRSGYRFIGWNTAADGSGTRYTEGSSITINADIDLYAQWAEVLAVTYNSNGATSGRVPVDGTDYTVGDTVTVKENTGDLAQYGYAFTGWNTIADGDGVAYQVGDTFSISSDNTLYAQWENTPPSVSIDTPSDGAQVSKNDIVTFTATISDDEELIDDLSVRWYIDGWWEGSDNPISMNALSDIGMGEHTITVSVTDNGGLTTEESVTIEVLDKIDSGITIEF